MSYGEVVLQGLLAGRDCNSRAGLRGQPMRMMIVDATPNADCELWPVPPACRTAERLSISTEHAVPPCRRLAPSARVPNAHDCAIEMPIHLSGSILEVAFLWIFIFSRFCRTGRWNRTYKLAAFVSKRTKSPAHGTYHNPLESGDGQGHRRHSHQRFIA